MNQVQGNGTSVPQFPPTNQNVTQIQGNGATASQFPQAHHTSTSPSCDPYRISLEALNENGTSNAFDLFQHVTARLKKKQVTRGQVSTEEPLGVLGNVTKTPGGFCNEIDQEQLESENNEK